MEDAIIRQGECFVTGFDKNDTVFCGKCGIRKHCEAEWKKKQAGQPYHNFDDYEFTTGLVDFNVEKDPKEEKKQDAQPKRKKNRLKEFLDKLTVLFKEKIVEKPRPVFDEKTGKESGKFTRIYLFNSGPVHLKVVHSEYFNAVQVSLSQGKVEKYVVNCDNLDDEESFKNFLRRLDKELRT